MKSKFTLALAILGISLQAQFEPFQQFFYKSLWENIPTHDSVTLWYDSVSPHGVFGAYSMNIFATGKLDTMFYRDVQAQENLLFYSGKSLGNVHVVVTYVQDSSGSSIAYDRTGFAYDQQNRIEYVETALHNGSYFEPLARMNIHYRTDNQVRRIDLNAYNGSGYFPVGRYQYYYTNARLDSVITAWAITGRPVEKYQPLYDQAGRMKGMDFYEYLGLSGGLDFSKKYLFHFNFEQEIQYVEEFIFHHTDSLLKLYQIFEYSRKKGSTINLPEQPWPHLEVFPNPTTDYLMVQGSEVEFFRLFDLSGKLALQGNMRGKIDMESLPSGTYLLHLTDARGNTGVQKIMKQ